MQPFRFRSIFCSIPALVFISTLSTGCDSDLSTEQQSNKAMTTDNLVLLNNAAKTLEERENFHESLVGRWVKCINDEEEGSISYSLQLMHEEFVETSIQHIGFDCAVSADDQINRIWFGFYTVDEEAILDDGNSAFNVTFEYSITQVDITVDNTVNTTNDTESPAGISDAKTDNKFNLNASVIDVNARVNADNTVNVPPEINAEVAGFLTVMTNIYTDSIACYDVASIVGGSLYFGLATEDKNCSTPETRPTALESVFYLPEE